MKVKGFLKDVGGASRITKARISAIDNASPVPVKVDPIHEVAYALHPGRIELVVTDIRPANSTCKTVRLQAADGRRLPLFRAGQYIVLDFQIGDSLVSRPYSISSAPLCTVGEDSFVEVTVRSGDGKLFVSDYVWNELKVGDHLSGIVGCGDFFYEPLRDAYHVVALAGGVGITPFASMAAEVAAGRLDIDLTIIYGAQRHDDIILWKELAPLEGEHVHFVHVISGEDPDWQGERGFITAELIKKYSHEDTTYFVCGPQPMYLHLYKEFDKLDLPARRVRFEVFGPVKDISQYEGYPQEAKGKTFALTVVRGIHEDVIPVRADESLAVALERAGIRIETGCRSGECGFCRSKVLSGHVYVSPVSDGRRAADKDFGYVHACAAYPLSDVKLKVPIL
ncbi:MAG: iron-sulfur cluster-binding domain-containing protein [Oscillospiraceae bacterium]|nr:iron-sulfur cluster-binding domain-containing protein [Oscillospiraceae bacterium]